MWIKYQPTGSLHYIIFQKKTDLAFQNLFPTSQQTLLLLYKDLPVNIVQGNNRFILLIVSNVCFAKIYPVWSAVFFTAGGTYRFCLEGLIIREVCPLHILQASHPFVSHSLSISFKINSLLYCIAFSFQSIDEPLYNLPFESYTLKVSESEQEVETGNKYK
jgi:hypothetical protein